MAAKAFLFDHFTVDRLVSEYRYDYDRSAAAQGSTDGADATVYDCGAAAGQEPVVIDIFCNKEIWVRGQSATSAVEY